MKRLVGIPSLVVQGDEISSSNHFFISPLSLVATLGAGPTAPDLVWLQRSPHRQRVSFQSFFFAFLLLPLCFSLSLAVGPHSSPALLLLAPLEEHHLQDVTVDAVVRSPSTPSADYED